MLPYKFFTLKDKISSDEIILLCLISNLSKIQDCTASNAYLSSILNTSERTIQRNLKSLKDNGIIETYEQRDKGSKITTSRTIYIQDDVIDNIISEAHDNNDVFLTEAHDKSVTCLSESNISTRQNLYKDMTDIVEGHDNCCVSTRQNCHPNNINNIKIKDNIIDNNCNFFLNECIDNNTLLENAIKNGSKDNIEFTTDYYDFEHSDYTPPENLKLNTIQETAFVFLHKSQEDLELWECVEQNRLKEVVSSNGGIDKVPDSVLLGFNFITNLLKYQKHSDNYFPF